MYYILARREEVIRCFPSGGVGVQVGVPNDTFAARLLERADPKELHLVDPWSRPEPKSARAEARAMLADVLIARALGKVRFAPPRTDPAGAKRHSLVQARFKSDSRVSVHRQYSYKAVGNFPDDYFDFVYLTKNRRDDFLLRDMFDFAAKLKPGGVLFGPNLFEDLFAKPEQYGDYFHDAFVRSDKLWHDDAGSVFLRNSDFRVFALSWKPPATFFLARHFRGYAGAFVRNLRASGLPLVDGFVPRAARHELLR